MPARNFKELEAKMPADARVRSEAKAKQMIAEMPLHELRAARELTQQQLAESLHMTQAAVSKMERRTDVYVSTLGKFIHAMGGELEIRAVFPDGTVRINQFNLDDDATATVEQQAT